MRFSDLRNLQPSNINIQEQVIILYQIKTSTPTILPVHDKLLEVLSKYELNIPKYSNQKFNEYVKELCKDAGIKSNITQTQFYGKDRKEVSYKKWQLISSHTGRRTFITLSLKRGALPEMVMQISGHKDRRAFEKYVKLAKGEAQEALKKIWEN
jgi:integrase